MLPQAEHNHWLAQMERDKPLEARIRPKPDEHDYLPWLPNPLVESLRTALSVVFYKEVFDYAGFIGDRLGDEWHEAFLWYNNKQDSH